MKLKRRLVLPVLLFVCSLPLSTKAQTSDSSGQMKADDEKLARIFVARNPSKLATAFETVILKLEKDGKWHVASYSIK